MATGPDNPIPPGPPSGARHADDPSLPAPLVADLRAAFASPPPIPQAVDRAVLDDARVLLRPRPAIIFTFRRAALALSTAAALALVAYVAIPSRRPAGPLDGLQLTDSRSRPAENTARSIESAGPSAATTPAAPGTAGGHDVAGASRP
ncbi:MAG: hypothetical protein JNJ48_01805, partial [Phycisphaerae bacterium]|nr:hypothetical protein [Phycisphaerae bacterium]